MTDWTAFDWDGATVDQFVPGDPTAPAGLGKQMRDAMDNIHAQMARLKSLSDTGQGWQSPAGKEFVKKVGDTSDLLEKVAGRFGETSTALGTDIRDMPPTADIAWSSGTQWASTLNLAQKKAADAIRRGQQAYHDHQAAQRQIDAADTAAAQHPAPGAVPTPAPTPGASPSPDPAMQRLNSQKANAAGDLTKAGNDLDAAVDLRNSEEKAVAGAINNVTDNDGLKESFWDWVGDVVADIGHIAGVIAAIAGAALFVLGMFTGVSELLIAVVTVIAAVTAVTALVCDTVSATDGRGTWLDVGIDVLGVLSLGAGKLLGAGVKAGATAARAEAGAKAISTFKEAWISGEDCAGAWEVAAKASGGLKGADAFKAVAEGADNPWFPNAMKTLFNPAALHAAGPADILAGMRGAAG
ncbi:hypothetical protein KGQ20_18595 [Catenulispora sp. NF23]|uniref:hypothetical protein n=1 Tax=Catenulispora pinistramenti TaxID=2705254 RepID=UPI001BA6B82F|nr:hypothetical protein [Catenulispora pinistramenti]MBS2534783.1 hypothetical protein [Catenulispora pinistramenti]